MNFINLHTHHILQNNTVTSIYNNRIGVNEIILNNSFSIGIHPWDIDFTEEESAFEILNKILKYENCLAVGECGLDKIISTDLKKQQFVFEKQINIALKYQKPVIIHCVKAFDELIEITKPFRSQIPFIIHGFNKSTELALSLIEKGFYLSLNPSVFHKSNMDVTKLPLSKLFLETDNDKTITIEDCYEQLAQKLNAPIQLVKAEINCNFKTVFYGTK